MTYQIKPLHCDPAMLKGLSEKLMDYGAKAAAYVDASMNNINWANAARLHEECIK